MGTALEAVELCRMSETRKRRESFLGMGVLLSVSAWASVSTISSEAAARLHHAATSGGGCVGWLAKPGKRTLARLEKEGAGLFDGSVYSGEVGLTIGLVDGVGEMRGELQKRFGRFVHIERMEEERLDYSRLLRWLF